MKKLIPILAVGLLLCVADLGYAQGNDDLTVEQLRDYVSESGIYHTRQSREVRGSPYLNKEWLQGHLVMENSVRSEQLMLRLNTYDQEVEFVRNEEVLVIPPQNLNAVVIYSEFGDIRFENGFRSEEEEIGPNTLLRVLHDGKSKLLVHHVTVLQEDMASYGTANQLDEYIKNQKYYFVDTEGTFHEIRLRERDFLGQMGEYADKVEDYANSNNLSFDEESEAAILMQYYDKLLPGEEEGSDS